MRATLERSQAFLRQWSMPWEIVVVDDGSEDDTATIVQALQDRDPRVRLIRAHRGGKGAAVRRGMIEARGAWRFMADADLSMQLEELPRFFEYRDRAPRADVLVGSREAAGSRRIGEPLSRHLIGRTFNALVRVLAVPGIHDTQCGYKLFSRDAATALFPRVTLDGFAFDVELLFLARRAGYVIREVPITWTYRPGSRLRFTTGLTAFLDIVRIRLNSLLGRYASERRSRTSPP